MSEMNQMSAGVTSAKATVSDKGFVPTILLCYCLGFLGVHRFYTV